MGTGLTRDPGRALAVERSAIQEAVDQGLLPRWHGRVILITLEDQIAGEGRPAA